MNMMGLTMAYLGRLGPAAAYDKLAAVVAHNIAAVRRRSSTWRAALPSSGCTGS